jgi:hypothetical protein
MPPECVQLHAWQVVSTPRSKVEQYYQQIRIVHHAVVVEIFKFRKRLTERL